MDVENGAIMLVDYMELRQATEKITELKEIIKQLRIELSEARQVARDMVKANTSEPKPNTEE